ncbi:MAG: Hcp family type VI secretion system effector [Ferruginibacter sp.]
MKKTFTFLLIFILACNITGVVQAPTIFMQISDPGIISGESLNSSHTNWIDIKAFQGGACAAVTISGAGTQIGQPTTNDFTFTTLVNKTTAHFKNQMYTGSDIPTVFVDFTIFDGSTDLVYYKIEMANAFVTSVTEAGTDADGKPLCNITLTPRKFRYTYKPIMANGSLGTPVIFGWDRVTLTNW